MERIEGSITICNGVKFSNRHVFSRSDFFKGGDIVYKTSEDHIEFRRANLNDVKNRITPTKDRRYDYYHFHINLKSEIKGGRYAFDEFSNEDCVWINLTNEEDEEN